MKALLTGNHMRVPLSIAVSAVLLLMGGLLIDVIAPNTYMLEPGGNTWDATQSAYDIAVHIHAPILILVVAWALGVQRYSKLVVEGEIVTAIVGAALTLMNVVAALSYSYSMSLGGLVAVDPNHRHALLWLYVLVSAVLLLPLFVRSVTINRAK